MKPGGILPVTQQADRKKSEWGWRCAGDRHEKGRKGWRNQPHFHDGRRSGTYYGFGGVLAGKIGESTSTSVTAITSGGSQANIEALDAHDADLGFVQSDVMAYATMVRISLKNMEKLLISRPWRRSIWSRCRLLRWIRRFSR